MACTLRRDRVSIAVKMALMKLTAWCDTGIDDLACPAGHDHVHTHKCYESDNGAKDKSKMVSSKLCSRVLEHGVATGPVVDGAYKRSVGTFRAAEPVVVY